MTEAYQLSTNNEKTENNEETRIKEIWENNVEEEMDKISELLETYNYIAMDTEFPGFVDKTATGFSFIRNNANKLKLIQVGITLSDSRGNLPSPVSTWQFNLKFDLSKEEYMPESIRMLQEAGIDFEALSNYGIDSLYLADLMMSSGLICTEDVHWITFHGAFDFAYLVKLLKNETLPEKKDLFKILTKQLFPNIYDIKIMVDSLEEIRNGSLSKLGDDLDVNCLYNFFR